MPSASFRGIHPFVIGILGMGCFGILFCMRFKMPAAWLSSPASEVPAPMVKNFGSNKEQNQTIILVWQWPFGVPYGLSSCSAWFSFDGCHLTVDRDMYSQSDGVIIHHHDIDADLSNMPPKWRPPFQKWVWMNYESPTNSRKITALRSLFNLTLNYRQDADIQVHYGQIFQVEGKDVKIPSKDKLVCWIVSNWNYKQRRVAYYNMLKKHLHIDIYGKAFWKSVSNEDFLPTIASCKFYLSFENSIHKDYITEKLYNPLAVGTVPIVLGPSRQNYENFVPGDAFIHVEDFPSPKELAEHILFLDKNEDMYHRYFSWRRHFEAKSSQSWLEATCLTCNYIRTHKENEVINDLNTWYWG